ncbi:MAG: crossover junction endodeoxyribonuclease RuvC [Deltaproteobacteria bacterium]|jgi:crossover junction endodeoxyribonuclease RuvC|nr:crossover junction endodeoxyribonuclease RuvC [Deltaproteobacteria bacterium]
MVKILGIDPGSQVTGFGILEVENNNRKVLTHGIIQLKKETEKFNERIFLLSQSLDILFLKYQPHMVSIEKIFLGKNPDSAFKLGHARGVCIQKAMEYKTEIFEYSTREVKKGITGSGGNDKYQVNEVLKHLLGIKNIDYLDASDALALAFHHSTRMEINRKWQELV